MPADLDPAALPADRRLWCDSVHPDDPTVHPGGHEPTRCPVCSRRSSHPDDIRTGYCAACHDTTGPGYLGDVDRAAGFAAVVDDLREEYLRVRPDPWAAPGVDVGGELDLQVRDEARARLERLDGEARELLAAGVAEGDLVVVTSPLWPDSRVVTRDQQREHAGELRGAVEAWAAPLAAGDALRSALAAAADAVNERLLTGRPALTEAVRRVGLAGATALQAVVRAAAAAEEQLVRERVLEAASPYVAGDVDQVLEVAEQAARELYRRRRAADRRLRLGPAIQPIVLRELAELQVPRRVPGDRPVRPAWTQLDAMAFWRPDGSPIGGPDPVLEAREWLRRPQRVALQRFHRGGVRLTVSTVFLVSGWAADEDPDLWETSVFHAHRRRRGFGARGEAWRYGSAEAALAGHRAVCAAIAGEQRARRAAWRDHPRTAPLGVTRLPEVAW